METVVDAGETRCRTEEERQFGSLRSGFSIPRWRPLVTKHQAPQKLYPDLVDSLAEKHLDFRNFCRSCEVKDRLRPQDWETAFWVGSVAGLTTWTSTLDIDQHDRIGWYSGPTRWHRDEGDSPHDTRYLPVPRPTLRFYAQAKLVFDAFPGRTWAFSSGSLGFAVWHVFAEPETTHVLDRKIRARLTAVGLADLEHYPIPKNPRSKMGKPHRRPCGMDSGIITPDGVLTDPMDQVRWMLSPKGTPDFAMIVHEHMLALRHSYQQFLVDGGSEDHRQLSLDQKKELVAECETVLDQVTNWMKSGCRITEEMLIRERREPLNGSELGTNILNSTVCCVENNREEEEHNADPDKDDVPACFRSADLADICEQGLWFQFVQFLVYEGFPTEDKVFEVVGTLARWFLFVEFFDRPDSETIAVLEAYVQNKHNNKISRLSEGKLHEVLEQIPRIVDCIRKSTDVEVGTFEAIRRRRATNSYRHVWNFGPKILGAGNHESNLDLKVGKSDEKWQYVPDDTALPELLVQKILQAFSVSGRQIRRGRDGTQPVLMAIIRLVNYLRAGGGSRRCGILLLQKMGFPTRGRDRQQIIGLLVRAGIVNRGGYLSKSRSRLWTLGDEWR